MILTTSFYRRVVRELVLRATLSLLVPALHSPSRSSRLCRCIILQHARQQWSRLCGWRIRRIASLLYLEIKRWELMRSVDVGVPKTNETPRHPEHPPLGPQVTFEAAALETNGIFLRACGQQQRHTDQTSGEQWRELESKFREALEHPLGSSGASQPNNPTGTSSVNMPMCITPTTSSTTLMMTLTEPWYLDWWCFAGDSVGSLPQRGGDDATPLGSAHHLSALDAHGLSRMTPGPSSTPYSNLLGNTWGY